MAQSTV